MFWNQIRILRSHGSQYIKDLRNVSLPDTFRGRPVLSDEDGSAAKACARMCPAGAITFAPLSIDLGRCLFCGECAKRFPQVVRFTADYRLGTTSREELIVTPQTRSIRFSPENVRSEIRSVFGHALKLRQVSAGGDGSCEMELNATGNVNFDLGRYGIEFTASARHADGVVITGPLTRSMAGPLEMCYKAMAEPKIVILAGSEAISGGLYECSDSVDRSFLDRYGVDLYLPGVPLHPMTFIEGVMNLAGKKGFERLQDGPDVGMDDNKR